MPKNKRVLIFSVSVGTGHTRAAEAIKIAMQENYPGSQIEIIDTFKNINPILGKLIFGTYLTMIKKMPVLYRQLYNNADEGKKFGDFSRDKFNVIIDKFTRTKILNIINDFNPDIIICTHPFPLGIMSRLKMSKYMDRPVAAFITDYIIHHYWIYKNIDKYFVAVIEQKEGLVARGIPDSRINVTGIPIHPHFNQPLDKEKIKFQLGLDRSLPTVMVMGGGLGMGPVGKIVKYLANCDLSAQLIVVVGKNDKLQRKLEEVNRNTTLNLQILGFVENVHELMEAADIFITKPGGLTVAEALAKGLPMLLTKPIPGHEEKNAEYLIKAGAALDAQDEKGLVDIINQCLQNPEKIKEMSQKASGIGNPSSADQVAAILASIGTH